MHRFYKITRLADGSQWIDIGQPVDLDFIRTSIAAAPLDNGEYGSLEFLIYEG